MSRISNLYYSEEDFSLQIESLELPDLGVTAIMGESGAGKSTLLNILCGMLEVKGWNWEFRGQDLALLPISERRLGVLFQGYDLFPHLSAEENLKLVLKDAASAENANLIARLKMQLKLDTCWKTRADKLSGGESQRVALARAFLIKPRILLLDEPFSALNAELRLQSRQMVKSLLQEYQTPALIVTHDQSDVDALADKVVHLKNGRITD